jgi:uncharacterized protein
MTIHKTLLTSKMYIVLIVLLSPTVDAQLSEELNFILTSNPLPNGTEEKLTNTLLFQMNSVSQKDLKSRNKVSDRLQNGFEQNGIPLSKNATLTKRKGNKWLITDLENGQIYTVREEADRLNVYTKTPQPRLRTTSEHQIGFTSLIKFYQTFISSQDTPQMCNFTPSCSRFGTLSIQKYGAPKGILLTADRLLRCNSTCNHIYTVNQNVGKLNDPLATYSKVILKEDNP